MLLTGARHTGKTMLAQEFPSIYFNIENSQDCTRLDMEWIRHMRGKELVILDEIQAVPELFLRLRASIDEQRSRHGRFLLLSSLSSPLIKSLVGRFTRCELSPLLAGELPEKQWDNLWRCGGYPEGGILGDDGFPVWQHHYLEQMAQRDLPNWGFPPPPIGTERLFRMLAVVHGQVWNASQIGKSLGISYHTVNTYVEFLEQAFLVRRLPACKMDLKKRLVKSPKLYWRDTGLLHTLLGLKQDDDLYMQPWIGVSWEGWVIEQILGHLQASGLPFEAYHLETSDRYTLDLVLEHKGQRWAIDITLTSVPETETMTRLQATADLVDASHVILLSRTTAPMEHEGVLSLNLTGTLDMLTA